MRREAEAPDWRRSNTITRVYQIAHSVYSGLKPHGWAQTKNPVNRLCCQKSSRPARPIHGGLRGL
jgi:hypothetical protein